MGGGDEPQGVIAQGQSIPLAHCHLPLRGNRAEKVLDHGEGLGGGHHLCGGIGLQEPEQAAGVIRLHMLNNDVVGGFSAQHVPDVVQPDFREMGVHRVDDGVFFIVDHIGIVGHTVGNAVLALKQVNGVVIDADVMNLLRNHGQLLLNFCSSVLASGTREQKSPGGQSPLQGLFRCTAGSVTACRTQQPRSPPAAGVLRHPRRSPI